MRLLIPIILLIDGTLPIQSQITISPEVGISYLPFTVYGANSMASSNRLDYLVGLSGAFDIHKKWYAEMRMSYSQREDVRWMDLCTCPGYLYGELVHSDLNIDLGINYRLTRFIHFGVGFMAIRKINSHFGSKYVDQDYFWPINEFETGLFFISSVNTKYIKFKMEYGRKIPLNNFLIGSFNNGHRFNFVLGYPIYSQRKK